jgi:glucans biosynthesis protein
VSPEVFESTMTRRGLLTGLGLGGLGAALLGTTGLGTLAWSQEPEAVPAAFTYEALCERMRLMAQAPAQPLATVLPAVYADLDYDRYRLIQFRDTATRWAGNGLSYGVQAFHLGGLYTQPVKVFEVVGGAAAPFDFSSADFNYLSPQLAAAAAATAFPGVAGIRLSSMLNDTNSFSELITFLGASYYRALGRDNFYGASARGLAINSWRTEPEEFPRFSEFYLERPTGDGPLVIHAALDSASVTGAYRFEILPAGASAQSTVIDVTARLYFRRDVAEFGVAPLTSMFLYAENNRPGFDDYRPQVHDSDGLLIERASGEVLWRPLSNTAWLGNSYFAERGLRAFGLYQRDRDFAAYEDPGAHYERRPSVRIEAVGDWGDGAVRLIEIPSRSEVEDNVVAFFIPAAPARAGEAREYRYRQHWGDIAPSPDAALAHVAATRVGMGGVSGGTGKTSLRKFVIDFAGGELASLDPGLPLDILANVSAGVVRVATAQHVAASNVRRLVLDVELEGDGPVELKAYLLGLGRKLTETWVYQWRAA